MIASVRTSQWWAQRNVEFVPAGLSYDTSRNKRRRLLVWYRSPLSLASRFTILRQPYIVSVISGSSSQGHNELSKRLKSMSEYSRSYMSISQVFIYLCCCKSPFPWPFPVLVYRSLLECPCRVSPPRQHGNTVVEYCTGTVPGCSAGSVVLP